MESAAMVIWLASCQSVEEAIFFATEDIAGDCRLKISNLRFVPAVLFRLQIAKRKFSHRPWAFPAGMMDILSPLFYATGDATPLPSHYIHQTILARGYGCRFEGSKENGEGPGKRGK